MPAVTSAQTSRNHGTVRLSFADGDTLKRFTVTDALVTTLSQPPICTVWRDTIADVDDPSWVFVANVVAVAAGSFDVLVAALSGDSPPQAGEFPTETVTLVYYFITT